MRHKLELEKTHDAVASGEAKLTVIMIHGIASDSVTYSEALKYLEKLPSLRDVRFVTFDLLGSGKSIKDDRLEYDYNEQLEALNNSINQLGIKTPLVLVGHSLGTFIVTRYASKHKGKVDKLILISPPIYTVEDLDNPAFAAGMKMFRDAVGLKNKKILEDKAFNNSIDKIVLNRSNYKTLAELKVPTTLIYGIRDQIIAPYNIPRILKDNPDYLTAIHTPGRHGVSEDKYHKLEKVLEDMLNAQNI